jgi:hypothetical protein
MSCTPPLWGGEQFDAENYLSYLIFLLLSPTARSVMALRHDLRIFLNRQTLT